MSMKIKKVDDKPMVIHTKKKMNIHKAESAKDMKTKGKASDNGAGAKGRWSLIKSFRDSKSSIKTKAVMEVNYVMTLDDYMAHLDMYELLSEPDFLKDMIKLGKTAAEESVWVENYVAANKTVMAKFCKDRGQLEHFMEGFYNDSNNEWRFDKDESSKEYIVNIAHMNNEEKRIHLSQYIEDIFQFLEINNSEVQINYIEENENSDFIFDEKSLTLTIDLEIFSEGLNMRFGRKLSGYS